MFSALMIQKSIDQFFNPSRVNPNFKPKNKPDTRISNKAIGNPAGFFIIFLPLSIYKCLISLLDGIFSC
jgi:hypothetical protein